MAGLDGMTLSKPW